MADVAVVPVHPTAAMIAAGKAENSIPAIWKAMLTAASDITTGDDALDRLRATRAQLSRGRTMPAEMIAVLPPLNTMRRNPNFWGDLEVRRLVIEMHRQFTISQALEIIIAQVGAERAPSKSALARAWKRLDRIPQSQIRKRA